MSELGTGGVCSRDGRKDINIGTPISHPLLKDLKRSGLVSHYRRPKGRQCPSPPRGRVS